MTDQTIPIPKKGMWWNEALSLVQGCTEVDTSCKNCWSRSLSHIRSRNPNPLISARYSATTSSIHKWTGFTRPFSDPLKKLLKKRPTIYAVWNDLLHQDIPIDFATDAFLRFVAHPQHFYVVLTKRTNRIDELIESLQPHIPNRMPENIFLGTSISNSKTPSRLYALLKKSTADFFPSRVISIEPLLDSVDLPFMLSGLDLPTWVLIGCESGLKRRPPKTEWLYPIFSFLTEKHIPIFFKQWPSPYSTHICKMPFFNGRSFGQFPQPIAAKLSPTLNPGEP